MPLIANWKQDDITAEQTQSLQQERLAIQQLKSEKQARISQETKTSCRNAAQTERDRRLASTNSRASLVAATVI